jgi:hypothetical protein
MVKTEAVTVVVELLIMGMWSPKHAELYLNDK